MGHVSPYKRLGNLKFWINGQGKSKTTNERLTRVKRGHTHLTHLGPKRWDGRGGKREKKERENEGEEEIEREKLYLISKFPGNQTAGFRQSKRQSASPQ